MASGRESCLRGNKTNKQTHYAYHLEKRSSLMVILCLPQFMSQGDLELLAYVYVSMSLRALSLLGGCSMLWWRKIILVSISAAT